MNENLYNFEKVIECRGEVYHVIEILDGYALVVKENPIDAKFPLPTFLIPWPIPNNK